MPRVSALPGASRGIEVLHFGVGSAAEVRFQFDFPSNITGPSNTHTAPEREICDPVSMQSLSHLTLLVKHGGDDASPVASLSLGKGKSADMRERLTAEENAVVCEIAKRSFRRVSKGLEIGEKLFMPWQGLVWHITRSKIIPWCLQRESKSMQHGARDPGARISCEFKLPLKAGQRALTRGLRTRLYPLADSDIFGAEKQRIFGTQRTTNLPFSRHAREKAEGSRGPEGALEWR